MVAREYARPRHCLHTCRHFGYTHTAGFQQSTILSVETVPGTDRYPNRIAAVVHKAVGIAAICGRVSGNLEVIDFESAAPFDNWVAVIKTQDTALASALVILGTPSGGHHVYYRCNDPIEGNQKLAMSEAGK